MLTKTTIALTLAAVLTSASAAMAAPTHHHRHAVHQSATQNDPAYQSYGAANDYSIAAPSQYRGEEHYYTSDDNGSTWSYYPGYVFH